MSKCYVNHIHFNNVHIWNPKPDIFHAVNKELTWNVENPSNIFNGNFLCKDLETDRKAILKNMKFK